MVLAAMALSSCKFINDDTLFLNWHDGLLIQTFEKEGFNRIIMSMKHPDSEGKYKEVLQVQFDRK